MNISKTYRKKVALLLIIVLILTSFTGVTDIQQADGAAIHPNATSVKEMNAESAFEKVDVQVQEAFTDDEYVDVFIELTEQSDTSEVAAQAVGQLADSATAYEEKMTRRYAVFDSLKSTAETTQASLISYLEKAKNDREIEAYESFYIMNVIHVTASKEVVEQLSYRPEVARIKLDEFIEMDFPEITEEGMQDDAATEWNIDRVQAPDAWDTFGVDGTGVVVGVIDSGADWQHEAIQSNWRGFDPNDPENPDPYGNWFDPVFGLELPDDTVNHGTHVTGTIMGHDRDEENIVGVAPGAQWIAARAFTRIGGSESDLIASGQYMLAPEDDSSLAPDIIQNSWGGEPGVDEWYRPMVEAWRDAGQMPVFSAGNGGPATDTVAPPGNYPESYAVAATDENDVVADFSSRGPSQYDEDQKPNISAPGVNIRSSIPGDGYGSMNGTSMAAPHIAGAAAMLLSVDASLTVDEIEDILNGTAIPLTDDQYLDAPNDGYGVGLLNVFDAVGQVAGGMGAIEGEVLTEGSDGEAPEISHSPVKEGFANTDTSVFAAITDDIAVTRAEIVTSNEDMNDDIVIPMELQAGDQTEGNYIGHIPSFVVQEPGFEYQINAYDYGENSASTDRYSVETIFGLVPDEYSEDFEQYPVGWMMEGDWEWGKPTTGIDPIAGNNLLATNLSGNYPNYSDSPLITPPLDLRDKGEASIRMNHWYDIEEGFDVGTVAVSNDYGENWEVVEEITGRDQEWRNLYIDLNDYAGSAEPVFVLFDFQSDYTINYEGWYVDNIHLVGEDTSPPDTPENLDALSSSTGVHLTWEAPDDLDLVGYNVYRSESAGEAHELIGSVTSTSFSDTDFDGGTEYFYVVTAYDYTENESNYSNEVPIEAPFVTMLYHSNFSEDDGGFTTGGTNNSWEWGEPASGPGEALKGDHVWATNLAGNYNTNENSWIESPKIEISGFDSANLHFTHWQDFHIDSDYGYIQISTDGGGEWEELAEFTERDPEWAEAKYSLDDYLGETIQLRFVMHSDNFIEFEGWYIDEVMVVGTNDDVDYVPAHEAMSDETMNDNSISNEEQRENKSQEHLNTDKELSVKRDVDVQVRQGDEELDYEIVEEGSQVLSEEGLPLDAVVTVLETDRTVQTDPVDGYYRMNHIASEDGETWTVRAEAYGYYAQETELVVEEDETTYQNFMLEPVPRGELEGEVFNERTGETIEGATVSVVEDTRIPEVKTDENGQFNFEDVIEGEYTLRIFAEGYHPEEVEVEVEGGETTETTVELSPFVGYENEIAYDNGIAENAAVTDLGNGYGVRMTPDSIAEVRGVNLYIWGEDFPTPGGNEIQIAVFDTDDNGDPSDMVIGPVDIEVERGAWNYLDLSEYDFMTDRDFIITTIQTHDVNFSPAVGTDLESNAERSYQYVDGDFLEQPELGNFMIRANVAYFFDAPVIETPVDGTYTTEDSIEVTGTVSADSEVTIYNNGEVAAVVDSEDEQFATEIDLYEGENEIVAEAEIEDGVSDPSELVTVIKDTIAPEINIDSPEDGYQTNRETVTVEGTAVDEHLDKVMVNGQEVDVAEDGSFSHRVMLDNGANDITVTAEDFVGNVTEESITVYAQFDAPEIENVLPDEDRYLQVGQTVQIEFTSNPGLDATFVIHMPLTDLSQPNNAIELPMQEQEEGRYVGYWTATNVVAEGAAIEVRAADDYGNVAREYADGRLYVNLPEEGEEEELVVLQAQFIAPERAILGQVYTIDAMQYGVSDHAWNYGNGQSDKEETWNTP
jgi:bacillopeptidase F